MNVRTIIAIGVAASAVSCSESTPVAPTPVPPTQGAATVLVTGHVTDFHSHSGVANVQMRFSGLSDTPSITPPVTIAATADASGRFSAMLPAADYYVVNFEPNGYASSGLVRVPMKHLDTELIVNPRTCAMRYGTVIDAITRRPIAGATVQRAGTATTDANGNYRIEIGCEPKGYEFWGIGTTTISANHPAYLGDFEFDGRREGTSSSGIRRVDFALTPR